MKVLKAFTLVELLVVIAIVGLLSTIVLAVTSGVSNQGRIAKGLQFSQHLQNTLGAEAVGIWNFDEGENSTVYDASGWGNNGTLINIPIWRCASTDTPSGQGCSLEFNGSTNYVNLGQPVVLNKNITNITITAWIKLNRALGSNSTNYEIFSNEVYQSYGYLFRVEDATNQATSGRVHFRTSQTSASTGITTNNQSYPNDQSWHHIVFTKNGTVGKIYLDGREITDYISYSSLSNPIDSLSNSQIAGNSQRFYGLIDEVRIYKTTLAAFQIRSQYYAGLDRLLAKELIGEKEYQQRITIK